MNKVDMLKLLTTVALLTLAPGLDAAPLVTEEPKVFEEQSDGDNKKPPDLWKTVTDEADNKAQATKVLDKLLRTGSMTTFPDGEIEAIGVFDLATSSPNVRDQALGTGINNPLKMSHTNGQEEIPPASDGASPRSRQQAEQTGLFRLSKVMDSTVTKLDRVSAGPGTREELVKMLSALEEFQKLMNNTLSHRITFTTRGNGNGRNPGKKNKTVVTDGNLKSTTATTVMSGVTSVKASTDHTDLKHNGKAYKKSLQSGPKKPNKRVCFWKYCSQN
ncbi:urotensin II-related peptide [Paramisgurnus dabryanus]|uniref:urotensin II-related peptide n=1 Tax=Paramisgurnus dabryanus TaxID=90735 RepID=UPI0031F370AD